MELSLIIDVKGIIFFSQIYITEYKKILVHKEYIRFTKNAIKIVMHPPNRNSCQKTTKTCSPAFSLVIYGEYKKNLLFDLQSGIKKNCQIHDCTS